MPPTNFSFLDLDTKGAVKASSRKPTAPYCALQKTTSICAQQSPLCRNSIWNSEKRDTESPTLLVDSLPNSLAEFDIQKLAGITSANLSAIVSTGFKEPIILSYQLVNSNS